MSDETVERLRRELLRQQAPFAVVPLDLCHDTIELLRYELKRMEAVIRWLETGDVQHSGARDRILHRIPEYETCLKAWGVAGFNEEMEGDRWDG